MSVFQMLDLKCQDSNLQMSGFDSAQRVTDFINSCGEEKRKGGGGCQPPITPPIFKEIIEGRKWLEEQREVGQIERRAFQEEQTQLLDWIEKAKEQLEVDKAGFLRREHDLLARILNERALLEIEKREFRQQRDADVFRLKYCRYSN